MMLTQPMILPMFRFNDDKLDLTYSIPIELSELRYYFYLFNEKYNGQIRPQHPYTGTPFDIDHLIPDEKLTKEIDTFMKEKQALVRSKTSLLSRFGLLPLPRPLVNKINQVKKFHVDKYFFVKSISFLNPTYFTSRRRENVKEPEDLGVFLKIARAHSRNYVTKPF